MIWPDGSTDTAVTDGRDEFGLVATSEDVQDAALTDAVKEIHDA